MSPVDIARIEYRLDAVGAQGSWHPIPTSSYKGAGAYTVNGFNAASYAEWAANDSLQLPDASWWQMEQFDLTNQVGFDRAQFRFVIKRGNVVGTQFNYGWLIDNFEVLASAYEIKPPTVEFLSPIYAGTVYNTGPFEINAKVKSNTNARIMTPMLRWTHTYNNVSVNDSILMTNVSGDSLWKAVIPQYIYGTTITYSIEGRDTVGNNLTITSGFAILFLVVIEPLALPPVDPKYSPP